MRLTLLLCASLLPSAGSALDLSGVPAPRPPIPVPASVPVRRGLSVRRVEKAPAAQKAADEKKLRTIRLSGSVNLSGFGTVPRGSSMATLTVSGWTTLSDQDGRMWQGMVQVSDTRTYFVNGSYVSGWAQPSAYVALYDSGRYLGTLYLQGTILVSGFLSNGSVSLNGFGTVAGVAAVEEPDPPKP